MTVENITPTEDKKSHPIPSHSASDLMQGGLLVHIEHEGQVYTLRITRAGKLILTK